MTSPPATFTILTKITCRNWISSCKPKCQLFLDTVIMIAPIARTLKNRGASLKKLHSIRRNHTVLQVWIPSQPIIWLIIIRIIPV